MWPATCSWGAFCGRRGRAHSDCWIYSIVCHGVPVPLSGPWGVSSSRHRHFPPTLMLSSDSLGHCMSWTCVRAASHSQQGNIQNKCIHQNTACIEHLLCACSSPWVRPKQIRHSKCQGVRETGKQVEHNRVFCWSAVLEVVPACHRSTQPVASRVQRDPDLLKGLEMPFLTRRALETELGTCCELA